MGFSNSPLVEYENIMTSKKIVPRTHAIDAVTIHCIGANINVEEYGNVICIDQKCIPNYVVGKDGRVGLFVNESYRSDCSDNWQNDDRAVTIEVASADYTPFLVKDIVYQSLAKLVADICIRNGIRQLKWSDSKDDRINYRNGCNMTVHRDFIGTACPGDFLMKRMPALESKVNAILEQQYDSISLVNVTEIASDVIKVIDNINKIIIPF